MKRKDIVKLLLPGVIVGFILGIILVSLVGVDKENIISNYIGGAMCCLVPTFLYCLIVLFGTAKNLKRKISFKNVLIRILPYVLLAGIIGLFIVAVVIERLIGIDPRTISLIITAIYEAILGVLVSTLFAYIALKKYIKDVKYTKRNK